AGNPCKTETTGRHAETSERVRGIGGGEWRSRDSRGHSTSATDVRVVEPVVVRLSLAVSLVPTEGRGERHVVEASVLHHLEIRVHAVEHAIDPPLEDPISLVACGVPHVHLDAMPLTKGN